MLRKSTFLSAIFILTQGSLVLCQSLVLNKAGFEKMELTNQKNINTTGLETFPGLINDTLYFIRSIEGGKDYEMVKAKSLENDGWDGVEKLNKEINSPYFEGPFSYNKNTGTLYFTRSGYNKRKINRQNGKQKDTVIVHLEIFEWSSGKKSGSKKVDLPIENYTFCDPAISPDGEFMVFSSDKEDGFGKRDLYLVRRDGEKWVGMMNLGKEINSIENEGFPYFASDNILIFSSNREGGSGGFDLYFVTFENGIWSKPVLLPKPVNSPYDDIGFILAPNGYEGFLASNRPGGKGEDDIYKWTALQPLWHRKGDEILVTDSEADIDVFVFEKLTLLPFPEAEVNITPLNLAEQDIHLDDPSVNIINVDTSGSLYLKWNNLPEEKATITFLTDDKGRKNIRLNSGQYYKIEVKCDICEPEVIFYKPSVHGNQLNLALQPTNSNEEDTENKKDIGELDISTSSGSVFVMENIYYQYDSDKIINNGENDLDILVNKMSENPDIIILLEAHTDSRGSEWYNLDLSMRRANTAKNYLVKKGVESERIRTKGLGESRLRNHCKNGVICTEEEHRFNRRTEVIVLPEE
jgi:outer membrane protein OmpA-like peptidoglycan-associated protein